MCQTEEHILRLKPATTRKMPGEENMKDKLRRFRPFERVFWLCVVYTAWLGFAEVQAQETNIVETIRDALKTQQYLSGARANTASIQVPTDPRAEALTQW